MIGEREGEREREMQYIILLKKEKTPGEATSSMDYSTRIKPLLYLDMLLSSLQVYVIEPCSVTAWNTSATLIYQVKFGLSYEIQIKSYLPTCQLLPQHSFMHPSSFIHQANKGVSPGTALGAGHNTVNKP